MLFKPYTLLFLKSTLPASSLPNIAIDERLGLTRLTEKQSHLNSLLSSRTTPAEINKRPHYLADKELTLLTSRSDAAATTKLMDFSLQPLQVGQRLLMTRWMLTRSRWDFLAK